MPALCARRASPRDTERRRKKSPARVLPTERTTPAGLGSETEGMARFHTMPARRPPTEPIPKNRRSDAGRVHILAASSDYFMTWQDQMLTVAACRVLCSVFSVSWACRASSRAARAREILPRAAAVAPVRRAATRQAAERARALSPRGARRQRAALAVGARRRPAVRAAAARRARGVPRAARPDVAAATTPAPVQSKRNRVRHARRPPATATSSARCSVSRLRTCRRRWRASSSNSSTAAGKIRLFTSSFRPIRRRPTSRISTTTTCAARGNRTPCSSRSR